MNKGKDNENLTAGSSAELDGVRRGNESGPNCDIKSINTTLIYNEFGAVVEQHTFVFADFGYIGNDDPLTPYDT
jgi:hypothetical protein